LAKIVRLEIENFRGIKSLDWSLPDTNFVCLVGRGDTRKSTILDAIRLVFFPTWNPSFDEIDFFNCETDKTIKIRATICSLPAEFLSQAKYGNYLRGWDPETKTLHDEADDALSDALTVELRIDKALEPKWKVITDRHSDDKSFSAGDRVRLRATYIGVYADRHLSWAKNSALSDLTDTDNISELLSGAAATARNALDEKRDTDLSNFDAAAGKVEAVAKDLGVPVLSSFKAHLDATSVNIQVGGLTLHDGDLPLRKLGLGSRRMLTSGIQKAGLDNPHITLIDEFEYGLEPHRISRLLKYLKNDTAGQYFITTHSPVVLRELTIAELFVVHSHEGAIEIVEAAQPALAGSIQGKIRKGAEAFLSRKVIVCEGATEVGLCKGFDSYWIDQGKESFSFQGVAMFDAGGGSNVRATAEAIRSLGYDVSVIVDTDDHFTQADADALTGIDVTVAMWEGGLTIEQFAFAHLPWDYVIASVRLAHSSRGQSIMDQVRAALGHEPGDIETWEESAALRAAIGNAAKGENGWFKRQDRGEEWALAISGALELDNPLRAKIQVIRSWIDNA